MQDLMSDFVARIHNAVMASNSTVKVLKNKVVTESCKKLTTLGYFEGFEDGERELTVSLKSGSIQNITRKSKPGQRVYIKNDEMPKIRGGVGYNIISTSQGVLSHVEAKKLKIGGELLFEIY